MLKYKISLKFQNILAPVTNQNGKDVELKILNPVIKSILNLRKVYIIIEICYHDR